MSNNQQTEDAPLLLTTEILRQQIFAGQPFVGIVLQQVAYITEAVTLAEAVQTYGLSGHCLVRTELHEVAFFIAGAPVQPAHAMPVQAPDNTVLEQRLAFAQQREAALQTDLIQAREDLHRVRREQIDELSRLHEKHQRVEEKTQDLHRETKKDLLQAKHGDTQLIP